MAEVRAKIPQEMRKAMSRTRRFFSPEDKVAILRMHFLEGVPVSETCKQLDLNSAQFYNWQRELFENGHLAFRAP
ncbi:MAG: hypothetical protein KatS3mg110_1996 [Pirellulaceae bacterium]|nr:MAG: hypothetical protein KatS3mg110_1996 [Pirellulaceae bacterium]